MNLLELRPDTTDVRSGMSEPDQTELAPELGLTQFPPTAKRLGDFFASTGQVAYLVGGAVRDALLGRPSDDLDVAVEGDALAVADHLAAELGGRAVVLDDDRHVVRVVLPEDSGGGSVDLSPATGGIHADLGRRDFTIDAMAVAFDSVRTGSRPTVIDPHGGAADIAAGIVRALSNQVFADDPARLLRGPRLVAQLEFRLDGETAGAIQEQAHLIDLVAPERIRDELLKLLAEPNATASLRVLDSLGLLTRLIPELDQARGTTQPKEHHWDVFDHSLETVGRIEALIQRRAESDEAVRATPWSEETAEHFAADAGDGHTRLTLLKLVGLLHDVGKPETKTVEDSGRIRFLGHHTLGAEMIERILERLRLNRRATELAVRMVEHHLRPSQMAHGDDLPSARAVYRYYRDMGDAAVDTLYLNMGDCLAARGPDLDSDDWLAHCRTITHILVSGDEQEAELGGAKLIDGNTIMDAFSLEPGPRVGRLIELVKEAHASGDVSTTDEAMEMVSEALKSGDAGA